MAVFKCEKCDHMTEIGENQSSVTCSNCGHCYSMPEMMNGIVRTGYLAYDERDLDGRVNVQNGRRGVTVESLVKRMYILLEDRSWTEVYNCCERVLNMDPECAEAYLGQMLSEYHCSRIEDTLRCETPIRNHKHYNKIIRYGSPELRDMVVEYGNLWYYNNAVNLLNGMTVNSILSSGKDLEWQREKLKLVKESYDLAATMLSMVPGFRDADAIRSSTYDKIRVAENAYNSVCQAINARDAERARIQYEQDRVIYAERSRLSKKGNKLVLLAGVASAVLFIIVLNIFYVIPSVPSTIISWFVCVAIRCAPIFVIKSISEKHYVDEKLTNVVTISLIVVHSIARMIFYILSPWVAGGDILSSVLFALPVLPVISYFISNND